MKLDIISHLRSRKVLVLIFAIIVVSIILLVASLWTKMQPMFSTYCSSIVMMVSAFFGSHAATDIMASKNTQVQIADMKPDLANITVKGSPKL